MQNLTGEDIESFVTTLKTLLHTMNTPFFYKLSISTILINTQNLLKIITVNTTFPGGKKTNKKKQPVNNVRLSPMCLASIIILFTKIYRNIKLGPGRKVKLTLNLE